MQVTVTWSPVDGAAKYTVTCSNMSEQNIQDPDHSAVFDYSGESKGYTETATVTFQAVSEDYSRYQDSKKATTSVEINIPSGS